MDDETEHRLARNEILFRETNEAIERGQWRDEPGKQVHFLCECARFECDARIPLTLSEYESVRRSPRRFVLVPGHEMPEIEMVVSRHERYFVVEKPAEIIQS